MPLNVYSGCLAFINEKLCISGSESCADIPTINAIGSQEGGETAASWPGT